MCMAAALLLEPSEDRAGTLGAACSGLLPGGSSPTHGLGCCKTRWQGQVVRDSGGGGRTAGGPREGRARSLCVWGSLAGMGLHG